jgi:hypothetical protein
VDSANNAWCVLDGVDEDLRPMAGDLRTLLRNELSAKQERQADDPRSA